MGVMKVFLFYFYFSFSSPFDGPLIKVVVY